MLLLIRRTIIFFQLCDHWVDSDGSRVG